MGSAKWKVAVLGAGRHGTTVTTLFSLILSNDEFAVICSAGNLENGRAWLGVEGGGGVAAVGAEETWSSPAFVDGESPGVRNAGAPPCHAAIANVELSAIPSPCVAFLWGVFVLQ